MVHLKRIENDRCGETKDIPMLIPVHDFRYPAALPKRELIQDLL